MGQYDPVADAADRVARDVAEHTMTVYLDKGLRRHLRFARPDRSSYWIVTWPGALAVVGDMGGGFVFRRTTDMFEFFGRNGNDHGINPDYWAEKLPGGRDSVRSYDEDHFIALVDKELSEYEREYPDMLVDYREALAAYEKALAAYQQTPTDRRWPNVRTGPQRPQEPAAPTPPAEAKQILADAARNGDTCHEHGARTVLAELEHAGIISDTWEWNLCTWTYEYLWFCHAIVWAIGQYNTAHARKPTVRARAAATRLRTAASRALHLHKGATSA